MTKDKFTKNDDASLMEKNSRIDQDIGGSSGDQSRQHEQSDYSRNNLNNSRNPQQT